MNLRDIALRNLLRRKARAFFLLAGLVTGVGTVVGLVGFSEVMTQRMNHHIDQYGANILIVPKAENLSLSYGGLTLGGVPFEVKEIHEEDLQRIRGIRNAGNIAAVGPLVLGQTEVRGKKILLAGVDFRAAEKLKPWWKWEGTLPGEEGILAGADAARALGLKRGDALEFGGIPFRVEGVLGTTGSQDDHLLFVPLKRAQHLLGKEGRITMAEVAALCKDCPVEEMVRQISEALPGARVMAIQQVVKGRMEAIAQFKAFSYGVSGVVVLVGGLVVLVTMMGSVRERTREIGIFRAVGFRRTHIARVILLEAALVSALAGILGYGIGMGATALATARFVEMGGHGLSAGYGLAGWALLLAMAVGLTASAYPALSAARLDPNDALRAL